MTLSHFQCFSLIACLSMALAASVAAQPPASHVVTGVVLDAETRAPVPGATVSAGDQRATTDAEGRFALAVGVGSVTVLVTAPSYFPLSASLVVGPRGLPPVELTLARDSGFATTVDVVAAAPAAAPATLAVAPVQVLRTSFALCRPCRG